MNGVAKPKRWRFERRISCAFLRIDWNPDRLSLLHRDALPKRNPVFSCACSLRSTQCAALPFGRALTAALSAGQLSLAICAVAATTPPPASDALVSLEKFEVIGTRPETADATALKLPTSVLDTPRSVTVFDASRLREQDIQTGGDLLFWVPGLNTNGAVQESYHFYARGYRMAPNDWRVDGFAGRVTGGSYNPNLFGVEQVSILKGPAGLLYGASGLPGGMINLVSKKPHGRLRHHGRDARALIRRRRSRLRRTLEP